MTPSIPNRRKGGPGRNRKTRLRASGTLDDEQLRVTIVQPGEKAADDTIMAARAGFTRFVARVIAAQILDEAGKGDAADRIRQGCA